MIRVLHVCDKFGIRGARVHGVTRLLSWWLPRFDRSRFDVSLVGLRPPDASSRWLADQGVASEYVHPARLVPEIRRRRPHIVHVHGYGGSTLGRIGAPLAGARTVLHEHAAFPTVPAWVVTADRVLASRTDAAVAVSESVRDFMVARRHIPAARIQVVYNGAPLEDFRPADPARVAAERARLGIPPQARIVGTLGRMDPQKGVAYLVEAAARVAEDRPDVWFVMAGDGVLLEEHRAHARRLRLDRMVFTGFVTDVPLVQSLFDVQVFPSLFEGTPLTLLEAMAARRPIVSTTVDGLGEVLDHDVHALMVPPKDPPALAEAIGALLDDPARAARLAGRAELDGRRYDVRETVRALEAIYERVAA